MFEVAKVSGITAVVLVGFREFQILGAALLNALDDNFVRAVKTPGGWEKKSILSGLGYNWCLINDRLMLFIKGSCAYLCTVSLYRMSHLMGVMLIIQLMLVRQRMTPPELKITSWWTRFVSCMSVTKWVEAQLPTWHIVAYFRDGLSQSWWFKQHCQSTEGSQTSTSLWPYQFR